MSDPMNFNARPEVEPMINVNINYPVHINRATCHKIIYHSMIKMFQHIQAMIHIWLRIRFTTSHNTLRSSRISYISNLTNNHIKIQMFIPKSIHNHYYSKINRNYQPLINAAHIKFSNNVPSLFTCPFWKYQGYSRPVTKWGTGQLVWFIVWLLLTFWVGLCFLWGDCAKDADHFCPNCQKYVGSFKYMG